MLSLTAVSYTHLDVYKRQILELPAGTYLCFRSRICAGEWDAALLKKYMQKYRKPAYVVANEYEDNLIEYHHCPYEVQILLEEK